MTEKKMESFVNCPECGELLPITLTFFNEKPPGKALADFEKMIGIGKSERFEAENKCKCGRLIVTTLHITAEANHE